LHPRLGIKQEISRYDDLFTGHEAAGDLDPFPQ
jgi:hypothetical protein